ncbi:MAG: STAS domain-containing protein [Candidatus Nanopelagicales bacterium]|jgi:anti-sigma B factor antagonist|nr:STAS domain-containing protein [Candidatus Nanopelagicales bacterium]
MDLQVQTRQEGDVAVLAASGEVDVYTAPDLDRALGETLAEGRAHLVIDLSGVSFLDSTGLGVLVKGLKGAREADGWLRLVVTSERIRKIFDITGLDAAMPLFDTVDDALRA